MTYAQSLFPYRLTRPVLLGPTTMREVAEIIAAKHGMTVEDLKAPTTRWAVTHPRQEAMARMREVRWPDGSCRFSTTQIAGFFGLKDHTTVVKGVRSHRRRSLKQMALAA